MSEINTRSNDDDWVFDFVDTERTNQSLQDPDATPLDLPAFGLAFTAVRQKVESMCMLITRDSVNATRNTDSFINISIFIDEQIHVSFRAAVRQWMYEKLAQRWLALCVEYVEGKDRAGSSRIYAQAHSCFSTAIYYRGRIRSLIEVHQGNLNELEREIEKVREMLSYLNSAEGRS